MNPKINKYLKDQETKDGFIPLRESSVTYTQR